MRARGLFNLTFSSVSQNISSFRYRYPSTSSRHHCHSSSIAVLSKRVGYFPHALENLSNLSDVERVIFNTHVPIPYFLLLFLELFTLKIKLKYSKRFFPRDCSTIPVALFYAPKLAKYTVALFSLQVVHSY